MSLLKFSQRFGVVAFLSVSAAGCGFQPLYGTTASGAQMSEAMKSVEIALIPGRVGQRIRNELIFYTQSGGASGPARARYRLEIVVKEELRNTLVGRDGDPQGRIVEVNTDFRLINIADNKTVFTGKAVGRAALDRVESTFANVRAELDAENRAAQTVADTIRLRVAAYLSGNA